MQILDATGTSIDSAPFTVQNSSESSCLGKNSGYIGEEPGLPPESGAATTAGGASPPSFSTSNSPSTSSDSSGSSSLGALIGALLVAGVAILGVIFGLVSSYRRRKHRKQANLNALAYFDCDRRHDQAAFRSIPYEHPHPSFTVALADLTNPHGTPQVRQPLVLPTLSGLYAASTFSLGAAPPEYTPIERHEYTRF